MSMASHTCFPHRTEAREQLRRQIGTLRFDLNTLASAKGVKAEKKKALELSKDFIQKVRLQCGSILFSYQRFIEVRHYVI